MTERTHYSPSSEPIVVEPRDQVAGGEYKPRGFWYEVDGDWARWCGDEGFGDLSRQTLHTVEFGDENMLLIDNVAQLDEFHAEYVVQETISSVFDSRPLTMTTGLRWDLVAERYDGIEIAPYQWSRRLADGFIWYYGWDCASGVIWRPRGVTVVPK